MINSLLKALQVMELFGYENPRLTIREISQRLDMPKTTVFNILNTLHSQGYVEKLDNAEYALGTAVVALGQRARVNVEIRDRAAPLLRELANQLKESVYLTVRDGDYALYIYAIESTQRLLARSAVGERAYLHSTSVGKAILAHLPDDAVAEVVAHVGLPQRTSNTITEVAQLMEELQLSRNRGYAIDNGENETGIYCVGAPIFDAQRQTLGACSISGTSPETVGLRRDDLADAIIRVAQEISRRMGYVPTRIGDIQHTI